MIQLFYVSSAVVAFDNEALIQLLTRARTKNTTKNITGMLLYKDGNFMQVLEGDAAAVHALYAVISADPRHRGTTLLFEQAITRRSFEDWSMGFRNLSDPELQATPGFSKFMNNPLNAASNRDDPTGCMELLNFFNQSR